MTEQNQTMGTINKLSLAKAVIAGAIAGLLVISLFIFRLEGPAPEEWGKLWRLKPLLLTPLICAFGGACCYFVMHLSARGVIPKALAVILCVLGSIFTIWMGIVLGLNGTMWN